MFVLPVSTHQSLVLLAVLLSLVGAALMSRFCGALRTRHQPTWLALGEPTVFYNLSIRTQWRVNKFIWFGEHRALSDRGLDHLADAIKALTIIIVVVLIAGAVTWSGEK